MKIFTGILENTKICEKDIKKDKKNRDRMKERKVKIRKGEIKLPQNYTYGKTGI